VLFSDDLEMNAVAARMTPGRSAVQALRAGCDMLLVCQSLDAARAAIGGVEEALGREKLSAEAVTESLARIHAMRRIVTRGAGRGTGPLRWPAHARLARRLAAG
jgi:beta-glucosidase-like glycosyl hydrolase